MERRITGPVLLSLALAGWLAGPGALAIVPEGEPVERILAADGISGWSAIDNRRLVLDLGNEGSYLLTLKHQCYGLAWAQNITVTMSNDTIWAGFDRVNADGLACPIRSIHRIDPKDL